MLRMGVIGYGYWGPNIVRNFYSVAGSQVTMVCDMNQQILKKVKKYLPADKRNQRHWRVDQNTEVVCNCHCHSGLYPLWTGQQSNWGREKRFSGKAVYLHSGRSGRSGGKGCQEKFKTDGGSHLSLHGSGAQNSPVDWWRRTRQNLLFRFHPG